MMNALRDLTRPSIITAKGQLKYISKNKKEKKKNEMTIYTLPHLKCIRLDSVHGRHS